MPQKHLSHVRILNTRCSQDQEPLNGMLEKHGATIWKMPVSEVKYLTIKNIALVKDFQTNAIGGVMLSSRHGVGAFHRWWKRNAQRNMKLPKTYVIGPSSAARFFSEFKHEATFPARMNGLALIQKVRDEEKEGKILWFRNRDARPEVCESFDLTFERRALAFDAYALEPKEPASELFGLPDFWVATSPKQAQRTLACFPQLQKVGAVCIGPTTAASLGQRSVAGVAEAPTLEALVQAVLSAASGTRSIG